MNQTRGWTPFFGMLIAALFLSACGAGASQQPSMEAMAPTIDTGLPTIVTALPTIDTGAPTIETGVPTTRAEVPRITVEELNVKMDNDEAIVVGDTRSENAYEAGHIPGAISFPASQVEAHMNDLDKDQEIILYCT